MTRQEIMARIEEEDVEFIRLQFTDMNGTLKNVAVTASQFANVLENKYEIDSYALTGGSRDTSEYLYLVPDLDTFVILPWRPQQRQVARFLCNVYDAEGKLCSCSPRNMLKSYLQEMEKQGYSFYVDPKCEFFIFHTDEAGLPTTSTHDQAGYLDVGPVDLGENARRDMVLALEDMGFMVQASHHATAPAQHEIDFKEAEAMDCADSIVTFRNTVRSIAKRFGLHATFMPKPVEGASGSAMALNISIYKDDHNIFNTKDGSVNDVTRWFIGGIIEHANPMCAMSNPLVNSYKRLYSGFSAPLYKTWSTKKLSTLVRVKQRPGEDTKVELRFPDAAADPYLAILGALVAGMDGIERKTEPGNEVTDAADTSYISKENKLPITLIEAVDELMRDDFYREKLGAEFLDRYVLEKHKEWDSYMQQVSNWELNHYLNRV